MSSASPSGIRDAAPNFRERLFSQEIKLQKLMKDVKKKEAWDNKRKINGQRLPHAAIVPVPVPRPPAHMKPIDPGEVGCCGWMKRRKPKKPKNKDISSNKQKIPVPPSAPKPKALTSLPPPSKARFTRTPLPPIGQKCMNGKALETEETKAMKVHQRKAEKKLRGTSALKKADLMITPNAALKSNAVAWEIVETSAPVAPLRPPSRAGADFIKEHDARPSSRCTIEMQKHSFDDDIIPTLRPTSRSESRPKSRPCPESRPRPESRTRPQSRTRCESRPGTPDLANVKSRWKLAPQTREEKMEKMKEKEIRAHDQLREQEARRVEKLMEEKRLKTKVMYKGRYHRLIDPDGKRRTRQIESLRRTIARNRGLKTTANEPAPARELSLDEQIDELLAEDWSPDAPAPRRRSEPTIEEEINQFLALEPIANVAPRRLR